RPRVSRREFFAYNLHCHAAIDKSLNHRDTEAQRNTSPTKRPGGRRSRPSRREKSRRNHKRGVLGLFVLRQLFSRRSLPRRPGRESSLRPLRALRLIVVFVFFVSS